MNTLLTRNFVSGLLYPYNPDKSNDIWYYIFINCNCVATRWQQYSTHLHTNSNSGFKGL